MPAVQDWPVGHITPQPPQLLALMEVSMHTPPQSTCGATQETPPVVMPAVVVAPVVPVSVLPVLVVVLLAVGVPLPEVPGAGFESLEHPQTMATISDISANRVVLCFIPSSSARSVLIKEGPSGET